MQITKVEPINWFVPMGGDRKAPIRLPFADRMAGVGFAWYRARLARIHDVFQQGHMLVPDRPGIGLELHETVVNRYRV